MPSRPCFQEEDLIRTFNKQVEEDRRIVISRSNLNELHKVVTCAATILFVLAYLSTIKNHFPVLEVSKTKSQASDKK